MLIDRFGLLGSQGVSQSWKEARPSLLRALLLSGPLRLHVCASLGVALLITLRLSIALLEGLLPVAVLLRRRFVVRLIVLRSQRGSRALGFKRQVAELPIAADLHRNFRAIGPLDGIFQLFGIVHVL